MVKRLLPKSEFARNVLTLMTGTAAAQVIPILISPILTRIYSAEEFGLFAMFTALFSMLSMIITLRYAYAIVLPKKDVDAASLVWLSIFITFIFCAILMGITLFFAKEFGALIGNENIHNVLYLLPISLLFFGIYHSLNYWNIRKKKFKLLAQSRVIQTGSMSLTQLGAGKVGIGADGLIFGYTLGQIISIFLPAYRWFKSDIEVFMKCTKLRILANKNKYIDYPKYTVLPALLGTFTIQAPIFFITKSYELAIVGFFGLTVRILAAPSGIISTSIGQVYLQRISEVANEGPFRLSFEVWNTARKLLLLSICFFLPIVIFGEEIFAIIFGEEWSKGGYYAKYISIPLAVRFVVSPLSTIFGVTNNVKLGSYWKYTYFLSTCVVLYFASGYSIEVFLITFIINEVIMYLFYFALIVYASKNYKKRTKK